MKPLRNLEPSHARCPLISTTRAAPVLLSLALLGALPAAPALAVATLTAAELKTLCADDEAASSEACRMYVRGFLDGAIATDPRVAMNVANAFENQDSLTARAYRTRLGRDLDRYGPSFLADFCVPATVPVDAVLDDIAAELAGTEDLQEPAGELVYRVLTRSYPCPSDD